MKINWKLRLTSASFWIGIVSAGVLFGQAVATNFGYNFDFAGLGKELTTLINTIFAILVTLGVTVDPTTKGVSDSNNALARTAKAAAVVTTAKAVQHEVEKSDDVVMSAKVDVPETAQQVAPAQMAAKPAATSATPVAQPASVAQSVPAAESQSAAATKEA